MKNNVPKRVRYKGQIYEAVTMEPITEVYLYCDTKEEYEAVKKYIIDNNIPYIDAYDEDNYFMLAHGYAKSKEVKDAELVIRQLKHAGFDCKLKINESLDESEYSDNLVDQISYDAGHEITEREYLDVISDRFYDELQYGHHSGQFKSIEDLEDFVEWLNRWIVSGKERFR